MFNVQNLQRSFFLAEAIKPKNPNDKNNALYVKHIENK